MKQMQACLDARWHAELGSVTDGTGKFVSATERGASVYQAALAKWDSAVIASSIASRIMLV
jgi:hypothetical protein